MAVVTGNDYDHIDIVNGSTQTRHMIKDASARADVADLKSALSAEDTFTTDTLGFVNYDYDTPYEQTPIEGSWKTVFGIKRVLQTIVLNRASRSSTTARIKISGNIALAGNASGAQAWTTGVSLIAGHDYAARIRLQSGTSQNDGVADIPSISVYTVGTSTTIATADSAEAGRYNFTATGSQVNLILYITTEFVFTDAEFLVTLEDLTAGRLALIEESLTETNSSIDILESDVGYLQDSALDLAVVGVPTLENGTNLDALSSGTYKVSNSTAAASMIPETSRPTATVGYKLIVGCMQQAAKRFQIAIIAGLSNPVIRFRFNTNGVWTEWKTVADADEVVKFISQNLTDGQQATARVNINAADADAVSAIQKKIGGTSDLTSNFEFTTGGRINWKNGVRNSSSISTTSDLVNIEAFDSLTLTTPIHCSDVVTGLAFYDEDSVFVEGSGIKDDYDNELAEESYEKKTIAVPDNAKYIRVTWVLPDNVNYDRFSCIGVTESSFGVKHEIPEYYTKSGYIGERSNAINEIASILGRQSFQCFFITDYHKSTNACVSPSLIAYLTKTTGIRNVIFGGDAITYGDSRAAGYDMLCDFLKDFHVIEQNANVYYITGNHEMNRPSSDNKKTPWEYKLTQDTVHRLFNAPIGYKITCYDDTNTFHFDDDTAKIRVICVDCNYNSTVVWANRLAAFKAMSTTPEGYAVVIFSHVACVGSGGVITGLNANFTEILDCAKAMNDGVNYRNYKSSSMNFEFDFTGHERTFAGVLSGHLHGDGYYYYDNRFPVISVAADTGALKSSKPERVAGETSEQLFDAVQIDVAKKRIYCTRVGYGNDFVFGFGDVARLIIPCSGITLDSTEATMNVGDTLQLRATITPSNTDDTVTWESSDSTKATVTNNGLVTVIQKDTSTTPKDLNVSIVAACGTKYAACTVTIPK